MTINEFIEKHELELVVTLIKKGNLRAKRIESDIFAVLLGNSKKSVIFQFTKGTGLRIHKTDPTKNAPFCMSRKLVDTEKLERDYKPVAPTMAEAVTAYLSDAQAFLESPSYESWKEEWDDISGFVGCRHAYESLASIIGHRAIIIAPVQEWQEKLEEAEV